MIVIDLTIKLISFALMFLGAMKLAEIINNDNI